MVFSTFQFLITSLLAVVCARAIGLSHGDLPILAMVIPALWILPQGGKAGLVLLGAMTVYGLTLPQQPISLSVSLWVFFPLLMVMFSKRSNLATVLTAGLVVVTLLVGVMMTQSGGRLGGSAWLTMMQTLAVIMMWWSVNHWKPSEKHYWWALVLILPLWMASLHNAALLALGVTGIIASVESLVKSKVFRWGKLLCWTLPTVSFAALIISPNFEVPNPVFVAWFCLLGTAWMTDYILRSSDEPSES
ncbi:hypothetical protein BCU68_11390 [Vibrio sp. 10N.286.49.B3]|uniref:hypothetical protein n=1 Tax=Vibrio sp. 10N.286.49.B3 TaxID=1880855 RepID=UPI000C8525A1|nr:hypothetical protein [Vibrio sp. 10N.286.49.B3]PMH45036.1 hypothetical protein BCU68_11390 [Vibrio sp. 10N.286.49.B3]